MYWNFLFMGSCNVVPVVVSNESPREMQQLQKKHFCMKGKNCKTLCWKNIVTQTIKHNVFLVASSASGMTTPYPSPDSSASHHSDSFNGMRRRWNRYQNKSLELHLSRRQSDTSEVSKIDTCTY